MYLHEREWSPTSVKVLHHAFHRLHLPRNSRNYSERNFNLGDYLHPCCSQPPVDIKTKILFQYEAHVLKRNFVLVSMGGLEQPEWSPCSVVQCAISALARSTVDLSIRRSLLTASHSDGDEMLSLASAASASIHHSSSSSAPDLTMLVN